MENFNYKVLDLINHYNFDVEHVSIQGHLKNSKIWNSKFESLIYIFRILNDLKQKFDQL
jgi:hypothetical protein